MEFRDQGIPGSLPAVWAESDGELGLGVEAVPAGMDSSAMPRDPTVTQLMALRLEHVVTTLGYLTMLSPLEFIVVESSAT